jgi:sulfur-oxidizing protein SoxB
MRLRLYRLLLPLATLGFASLLAAADPVRLLVLHTNDMHDHLRPGADGVGGLPYVAGYVAAERSAHPAMLVLDAGDVTEKGDLVAFRTHGVMTYEAMRRIGYDGVAVGNHDFDDLSRELRREFERALGQGLLCLNIVRPDGAPEYTASRLIERGGLRIGLTGLIVPRDGGLDFAASGRALAKEAAKLRAEGAQLVVAVCHESVPRCADWARMAPDVNLFVSGHSHQALAAPLVVPETGALVVQAGSYARWVGRLELEIDPVAGKIVHHAGRLVPMEHANVPADAAMLAWVRERERALAPEAADFVCDNPAELDGFSVARLAAEALRRASGAEIGFCHPYQVIRAALPAGRVDVNAVFTTGGHRGHETVLAELTGAEIEAYVNGLVTTRREPPEWVGFRIARRSAPGAAERWVAQLEPARRYRVIFPKIEWETRFLRLVRQLAARDPANPLTQRTFTAAPATADFTTATADYLRELSAAGDTPAGRATRLAQEREVQP